MSESVLTNDKIAALKRLSEAWGPHSEDGKLTAWAAAEIERLGNARLRDDSTAYDLPAVLRRDHRQSCACVECRAADEIERLRFACSCYAASRDEDGLVIDRLRAALQKIEDHAEAEGGEWAAEVARAERSSDEPSPHLATDGRK